MAGRPRRRARRNTARMSGVPSLASYEGRWIARQEGVVAHESASVYVDEDGDRWALAWVRLPRGKKGRGGRMSKAEYYR